MYFVLRVSFVTEEGSWTHCSYCTFFCGMAPPESEMMVSAMASDQSHTARMGYASCVNGFRSRPLASSSSGVGA